MKKTIALISISFLFLSLSEFFLSRKEQSLQSITPSPSIELLEPPTAATVNQPLTLTWQVIASQPQLTTSTTIYYDQISTPSAVTKQDPPSSLGYHFHLPDYSQGDFPIPNQFSASLTPKFSGPLYFRAYAFVNNEHLWTKEYSLVIK